MVAELHVTAIDRVQVLGFAVGHINKVTRFAAALSYHIRLAVDLYRVVRRGAGGMHPGQGKRLGHRMDIDIELHVLLQPHELAQIVAFEHVPGTDVRERINILVKIVPHFVPLFVYLDLLRHGYRLAFGVQLFQGVLGRVRKPLDGIRVTLDIDQVCQRGSGICRVSVQGILVLTVDRQHLEPVAGVDVSVVGNDEITRVLISRDQVKIAVKRNALSSRQG